MEFDIRFQGRSLPLKVEDPYRFDAQQLAEEVHTFLDGAAREAGELHLAELLPRMVRGVAGCEAGCPADAKHLVRTGFRDYELAYVDGGILTARRDLAPGAPLEIRLFPDF
ncbi:MAG: hypothetical protein D6739_09200 [Nitrospirae bacterium]|nr:MAG: hypothetical protein D6739_09200 [Nitrospirota bacterium]